MSDFITNRAAEDVRRDEEAAAARAAVSYDEISATLPHEEKGEDPFVINGPVVARSPQDRLRALELAKGDFDQAETILQWAFDPTN